MKKSTFTLLLSTLYCVSALSQFASQKLDNLTKPTAINQSLLPRTDNQYSLGSTLHSWKNLSLNGIIYIDSYPFLYYTGNSNRSIFLGTQAGNKTTGPSNTGVGYRALFDNTSGYNNTALGYKSLYSNIYGSGNTALGTWTLYQNTTGTANTAIGEKALYSNTTGSFMTASGYLSLYSNTTGYQNIGNGAYTLQKNTSGYGNIAVGFSALQNNTTGFGNVAIGDEALQTSTLGHFNTAIGAGTLHAANFLSDGGFASWNTAVGAKALYTNTGGFENTAIGVYTMYQNTAGQNNTAVGVGALYSNVDGGENTAMGQWALFGSNGRENTATGYEALFANANGRGNTMNGHQAGVDCNGCKFNTGVGGYSLIGSVGDGNAAVGYLTGNGPGINYSSFLGYGATGTPGITNATAIGYQAFVPSSNHVVIGNPTITSIGGYANWTNISDGRYKKDVKENVPGLEFINKLRPVTYTLDIEGLANTNSAANPVVPAVHARPTLDISNIESKLANTKKPSPVKHEVTKEGTVATTIKAQIVYTGFVAQEVEKASKAINYEFSGVDKPESNDGLYGLRYAEFVVPLVKAVQELSKKTDEVETLKEQVVNQQKQIDELRQMMLELKNGGTNAVTSNMGYLEQNSPNPVRGTTTIRYRVPELAASAILTITNVKGQVVKTLSLNNRGTGQVNLNTVGLAAGTYNYCLYVDGKQADTKRLVVAR